MASLQTNKKRNKRVIITSKRHFDIIITCLLRYVCWDISSVEDERQRAKFTGCFDPCPVEFILGNIKTYFIFPILSLIPFLILTCCWHISAWRTEARLSYKSEYNFYTFSHSSLNPVMLLKYFRMEDKGTFILHKWISLAPGGRVVHVAKPSTAIALTKCIQNIPVSAP